MGLAQYAFSAAIISSCPVRRTIFGRLLDTKSYDTMQACNYVEIRRFLMLEAKSKHIGSAGFGSGFGTHRTPFLNANCFFQIMCFFESSNLKDHFLFFSTKKTITKHVFSNMVVQKMCCVREK